MLRPRALAVFSRVEDWRGTFRPVSSPRHLKPGVPIAGTGLSWSLRVMGYETSCRRHREPVGPLRSTGITPLRRYYGPLRHPLTVDPLPISGYRADLAPPL